MNNILHKIKKKSEDIISAVKPTLKKSKFYEEGKLTPEEFVEAGDFLTSKCPTWKWCAAKEDLYNKALPKDKQYLKTTVPSYKRAEEYLKSNVTTEKIVEGDWVDADLENKPNKNTEKPETIVFDGGEDKKKEKKIVAKIEEDDDDDFKIEGDDEAEQKKEDNDFEIVDEEEKKPEVKADVVKSRTYDVTVTYDFYYCVPRMWLIGYNEKGVLLTDDEMKEDVMPEYRNKTCTIEPQTCTGEKNISVHPCRHSLLLKKMIQDFQNSGKKLEVHMSILLFLKFLQSVVPTVQYDFTMDISF
jgi:ubiquitin-like-conjugating enzyme ATG3